MKNIRLQLVLILVTIAFVSGCHDSTPFDPSSSRSGEQPIMPLRSGAVRNPIVVIPTAPTVTERDIQLVDLPAGLGKETIFYDSKLVTVGDGGVLSCTGVYLNLSGKLVSRTAKFVIPPNAVKHDVQITMVLDTVHLGVMFEPSGLFFDRPAVLSFQADGLDLSASASPLDFYYIDDNTNVFVPVEQKILNTDVVQGTIDLQTAEIYHFSRYGFGR
ncbi:MAG: hypothetical protein HYR76_08335 [Ignavibacteria bacterium]|nr:hypothetical protein [Ignavibacteria bacterium]